MKRVSDLTPTEMELNTLNALVVEVQKVFDSLILTPNTFSGCVSMSNRIAEFLVQLFIVCVSLISKSRSHELSDRSRKEPS